MSLAELGFSINDIVALNKNERISVAMIAVAGGISALSTTLLLSHILTVAVFGTRRIRKGGQTTNERTFITTRIGLYVSCLMVCGLLGGVASVLETMWAMEATIYSGPACSAQGVLIQLSDVGTAVFTTLIAFHTFNTLVLRKRLPTSAVICTIALAWIFAGALAGVGPFVFPAFYGNVGLWCWISSAHPYAQLFMHYVPMFLAAILVSVLYGVVYFSLRGNLFVEDNLSFTLKRSSTNLSKDEYQRFLGVVARKMFWYPIVYIALITPISVCRMLNLARIEAPYAVWVAAAVCISLMGFANVIVYTTTRNLGRSSSMTPVTPFVISNPQRSQVRSIQSFAALEKGDFADDGYLVRHQSAEWQMHPAGRPANFDSEATLLQGPGAPYSRSISPESTAVGSASSKKSASRSSDQGSVYTHYHTSSTSSGGTATSREARPDLAFPRPLLLRPDNNAEGNMGGLPPPPRARMVGKIVTRPRSPPDAIPSALQPGARNVSRNNSLVSLYAVGGGGAEGSPMELRPTSPYSSEHGSFQSAYNSPINPEEPPSPKSVYHPLRRTGTVDSLYVKHHVPPEFSWRDQMHAEEFNQQHPMPGMPAHPALRAVARRSRSLTSLSTDFIHQQLAMDNEMEKRLSKYRDVNVRTGAMRRPSISSGQSRLI